MPPWIQRTLQYPLMMLSLREYHARQLVLEKSATVTLHTV